MGPFEMSFGSVPLPLDTPAIKAWMARNIPLNDLRFKTQQQSCRSDVKLYSWYYPTGASRWSEMFALCDGRRLRNIERQSYPQQRTLVCKQAGRGIASPMYLLPPMALAQLTADGFDSDLYLLHFVDSRYFAQYANTGGTKVDNEATWAGLFVDIVAAGGLSGIEVASIHPDYLKPEPHSLMFEVGLFANAATMMDLIAESVGHRIIRSLDGSLSSIDWLTAHGIHTNNLYPNRSPRCGTTQVPTNFNRRFAACPSKVTVTFPKFLEDEVNYEDPQPLNWVHPRSSGTYHKVDVLASSITMTGTVAPITKSVSGTAYTVNDSAKAIFATSPHGATPTNSSQLNTLAQRIAQDYYDWHFNTGSDIDVVLNGIQPWESDGFVDIEWNYTEQYTRLQSPPQNQHADKMYHSGEVVSSSSSSSESQSSSSSSESSSSDSSSSESSDSSSSYSSSSGSSTSSSSRSSTSSSSVSFSSSSLSSSSSSSSSVSSASSSISCGSGGQEISLVCDVTCDGGTLVVRKSRFVFPAGTIVCACT